MLFHFRRKEIPWEVVDSRAVEPVPMYYDDEGDERTLLQWPIRLANAGIRTGRPLRWRRRHV